MPASVKAGDVVKVAFTNKSTSQPATVIGVVEAMDTVKELATVFVGNKESWSVSTASLTALSMPPSFSWTAADTQSVRSTASAFLSATPKPAVPVSATNKYQAELEASLIGFKDDAAFQHAGSHTHNTLSSSSFRDHDNYSFAPNASYTNVLYEINARLTGLCNWSSPPLTALFLAVLYLWILVEGSGALLPTSGTPQLLHAASVARRCLVAVVRTLLAVVLCTCLSMAPRQTPSSTFWLLYTLIIVSFGGLMPVWWWDALVLGCFPIPLPASDRKGTAAPGSAPVVLWLCKASVDGVRCVLRALSTAMIATGESLRAVSEDAK